MYEYYSYIRRRSRASRRSPARSSPMPLSSALKRRVMNNQTEVRNCLILTLVLHRFGQWSCSELWRIKSLLVHEAGVVLVRSLAPGVAWKKRLEGACCNTLRCAWVHAWCCATLREALACIVGSRGSCYIVRLLTKYMYARDGYACSICSVQKLQDVHVMLRNTMVASKWMACPF